MKGSHYVKANKHRVGWLIIHSGVCLFFGMFLYVLERIKDLMVFREDTLYMPLLGSTIHATILWELAMMGVLICFFVSMFTMYKVLSS